MKLFTCTNFVGNYPIGTAAAVVAENEDQARHLLLEELNRIDLPQPEGYILEFTKIPMTQPRVEILCNGNY